MQSQKNNNDRLRNYAKFSGIAFEMIVIIGGGTWLGVKLDEKRTGDFPLFTLIFSLASVAISIYLVIKQAINGD